MMKSEIEARKRYGLLDSIRGLVLISMIFFHGCWDLVYIFGVKWKWYEGTGAYIWQQSICWTFILLSGFCWSLGKHPFKRGLIVFCAGELVSLITFLFMPAERVEFGVLTCIGSCMLLMIILEKGLRRVPALLGFMLSAILFTLTRNINGGFLGFESWNLLKLPKCLYQGKIMTFLGFMKSDFFSTDYFSLLPWLFLFITGYFLYRMMREKLSDEFWQKYLCREWKAFSFIGRHSLIIYMAHQPVIYGVLVVLDYLKWI